MMIHPERDQLWSSDTEIDLGRYEVHSCLRATVAQPVGGCAETEAALVGERRTAKQA